LWTSACALEEKGIKLRSAKLAVVSSIRGWMLSKPVPWRLAIGFSAWTKVLDKVEKK